jgi:CRP/FNR family transcriptional regulator, cyclic AMP receptor protein
LAVAKKSKPQFDPRAFLAKGDGGVTVSIYRRGQIVFTQGDPADCIFFIQVGKVKVTVVSQQGKEAIIAFLEAGDFIGEGCLTGRPRRVSTARALTDCTLTLVHRFRGIDRVELPVISYESCLSCGEHSGLSGPSI